MLYSSVCYWIQFNLLFQYKYLIQITFHVKKQIYLAWMNFAVGPFAKIIYYTPSQIYAKVPSRTKAIF